MPGHEQQYDRIVFESDAVRIGAFRCHAEHPSFEDTGPAENCCFVFPRTAVEIQHEHESGFVANPNVVTFYNPGQAYARSAISPEGDYCDWFGVDPALVREVVSTFDRRAEDRPERPFPMTHGWTDSRTYLLQRKLFTQVTRTQGLETLAVEEAVVELLGKVVRFAYECRPVNPLGIDRGHRAAVRDIEALLSGPVEERLTLNGIARDVGLSPFHVCRIFRRVTGTSLHQYRLRLRLRAALKEVSAGSSRPLTDIALEAGFSSHSHFTDAFRREFGETPSAVRARS